MGMRTYRPMRLAPTSDFLLKNDLQGVNEWLRMLSTQMARVPTAPQGTPSASVTSFNANDYLYLPGRIPWQNAEGRVRFTVDDGVDAQPLGSPLGISFVSTRKTSELYFFISGPAMSRWTFPSLTTSPQDSIFVATSGTQTLAGKTLAAADGSDQNGTKYLFNSGGTNWGFFNSTGTRGFNWALDNLPLATQNKPTITMPSLDTNNLTDGNYSGFHSWCVMHSQAAAPYPVGSVLFGGYAGRELYGLASGTNESVLQFCVGEDIAGCTWTTGTTTINGTFDVTKTKIGMRVSGEQSISIYVPDGTTIIGVTATTITTSQALVGNATSVTVHTWGPIWVTPATLSSSIDHHSLLNLTTGDDHMQYLLLAGRATGQRIGTATQTGNSDDIAMSGRFNLGTGSYTGMGTTGCLLQVSNSLTNTSSTTSLFRSIGNVTASGSATVATYQGFLVSLTGGGAVTSGTLSFIGANLSCTPTSLATTGVTVSEITGLKMTASGTFASQGPTSSISSINGLSGIAKCGASYIGNVIPVTQINGILAVATTGGANAVETDGICLQMDSSAKQGGVSTFAKGVDLENFGLSSQFTSFTTNATVALGSAIVTNVVAIANVAAGMYVTGTGIPANTFVTGVNVPASTFTMNNAATAGAASVTLNGGIGTWYGIYRNAALPSNVQTSYFIYLGSPIPSVHSGSIRIGDTTAPTQLLELAAGTTTKAPLLLTSGTSLTTPVAGAVEFTTDDFFATITTGAARKAFVLDDGARLTSGRVPFATTNGRLVDDAGFLFAAGSGLTLSALNLITDTTTGMKIGTATNQKLGFWNTAPIIQPTTAGAASTFVANTSGIVDDSATWDGYTMGQVVKALRNVGLLA